jgi:hypothetical protein
MTAPQAALHPPRAEPTERHLCWPAIAAVLTVIASATSAGAQSSYRCLGIQPYPPVAVKARHGAYAIRTGIVVGGLRAPSDDGLRRDPPGRADPSDVRLGTARSQDPAAAYRRGRVFICPIFASEGRAGVFSL